MVIKTRHVMYLIFMFLFLYAPIFVLVFYSFNEADSMGKWSGFSLKWYIELFNNEKIQDAFVYTIVCAIISTTVSTILGTISALGIYKTSKKIKETVLNINYFPVINPDIVTAVSLMILYVSLGIPRGFSTMVLAHIMFSTPFVILTILPRLNALDPNMLDAATDLGATPLQAIRKVIIPEIMPGIVAGALIAFTMSIDDFVISYFNTSNGVTNLSIEIYNMAKKPIRPTVNALASLMVACIVLFVFFVNRISYKNKKERF
ncbi:ABC transporter permease [Mycoplasmatota bacterium]|nr:ABC transporter permease [Mycoplasmatota bacterium]